MAFYHGRKEPQRPSAGSNSKRKTLSRQQGAAENLGWAGLQNSCSALAPRAEGKLRRRGRLVLNPPLVIFKCVTAGGFVRRLTALRAERMGSPWTGAALTLAPHAPPDDRAGGFPGEFLHRFE